MAGHKTAAPMHCTSLEDLTSALEKDISVDCYQRESNTAQKHRPCQQVSHVLHTASLMAWNISHVIFYALIIFSNNEQGHASFNRTPSTEKKQLCAISLIGNCPDGQLL